MSRQRTAMTLDQTLRDRYVDMLLQRPNPGSIADVMFQADVLRRFTLTGEIVGFCPAEEPADEPAERQSRRKPAGRAISR